MSPRPYDCLGLDPFDGRNPFFRLGASALDSVAALADTAERLRLRAADARADEEIRLALRTLTASLEQRVSWALFTPLGPVPAAGAAAAGALLGRVLFGGVEPTPVALPFLAAFAGYLSWDLRPAAGAGSDAEAGEWWRLDVHRHHESWEYWHALALVYLSQAIGLEGALAAAEAACSNGSLPADPHPAPVESFWLRGLVSWDRARANPGLWAAVTAPIEDEPTFPPDCVAAHQEELPRYLVRLIAARAESLIERRNRLSAARHLRFLSTIASDSRLTGFGPAATVAQEGLKDRVWATAADREDDPLEGFEVLLHGRLLVQPDDPDALAGAFQAMVDVANREYRLGEPPNESVRMCRLLGEYAELLNRRVFPSYPRLDPVSASEDKRTLKHLFSYHSLLANAGDAAERIAHEPCFQALSEALGEDDG